MNELIAICPRPSNWFVNWAAIDRAFSWIHDLAGCPQDPTHHAEGDVWIHCRMVCEALAALPAWRALAETESQVLFAAALLHDVAKPECTRSAPDGKITSRGHARRGSVLARRILWRLGMPFTLREQVTALVRHHQVPYYLMEQADPLRTVAAVSQTARCDHLAILAEADIRGRHCGDQGCLLENVTLFAEYCREQGCLPGPREFPSDHTRFVYFRSEDRHPDVPVHDDTRCEVVLMSGLPGAGKDHWVRRHHPDWPVVSLDVLREDLDIDPADGQGVVIQQARELARAYLRQSKSFVWNATNLSRQIRETCIGLFADYKARIRIVYLEAAEEELLKRNRQRPMPVPQAVMERLWTDGKSPMEPKLTASNGFRNTEASACRLKDPARRLRPAAHQGRSGSLSLVIALETRN